MGRRRKSGERIGGQEPDDYFRLGAFEMARFGRVVISRMNVNEEQRAQLTAALAASYPEIVDEVEALISAISARIARMPPLTLLQRGWWAHAAGVLGFDKDADRFDQGMALRMIDYVQSVVVSVPPSADQIGGEEFEREWQALSDDVRALFTTLSLRYPLRKTATRLEADPNLDMGLEEFRTRAELLWMNVRGERYHVHEAQALLDKLGPHSDILEQLFAIDAPGLVAELETILAKLTRGIADLTEDMREFEQAMIARMEEIAAADLSADLDYLCDKAFEDPTLQAANKRVVGGLLGFDLFNVAFGTRLPEALAEALSYGPGEEEDFFSPGPMVGWPLRVWPVMKRPFLKVDGRYYCFDMFSLFDNFYRVLQRLIFERAPEYRVLWNERQQAVSEALPFDYLQRILPCATVHRPVYYRWKSGDGPAQWHEADGLLIYDDHLLVVEVKAGAFTYTSPATDLAAHIASLENLILSPAKQGSRFLDYLESAGEVSLYDADHREIARLRREDYRSVALLAVTLDPFTDLAARAQHLRRFGIEIGARPLWCLSIDDLRAYADLFDDPLLFLHYIEQRIDAAGSELVELDDELDHLGMYLAENQYRRFAAEISASNNGRFEFNGYRTKLDEFFSAVIHEENPSPPRQEMPARLAEVVAFLSAGDRPGRSMLASFLLDAAGDERERFATSIDQGLDDHVRLGRTRPSSSYGELSYTHFVWSPSVPRDPELALDFTRAIVAGNSEPGRLLIEITCDETGRITDVEWSFVTLEGLNESEVALARAHAKQLADRRVTARRALGKIRVNEQCPCGSGRKYKKCHGARYGGLE
ncbi:SEC-C metal-binding domain-containing protein [Sphingopyxis sp.]|uniref:YecA family protein n=1 Tax=Sphingopyxis sp. TaxID=1908224 RepID=UPI0010F5AD88|nr:SEC-C metal-binding domain-containing protein [Sphingopyxis sp.]MBR2174088.1 preprotein translocase subunit SecA [Sphingopyxis sp.]